jgi:hypothetical protein
MIKPEEMSTARIRKYVKDNSDRVEEWRLGVLRKHLITLITDAQGDEETPHTEFDANDFTSSRNQHKIFFDIMGEYELCYKGSTNRNHYRQDVIKVYQTEFFEMIEDIEEVKPVFDSSGVEKTKEENIYQLLNKTSLAHLVYIFNHQDDFCFMNKTRDHNTYGSGSIEGLGVFYKTLKDEADNLSFRNALDDFYNKRLGEVSKMVFGNEAPQLNPIKPDYSDGCILDYSFTNVHGDCLPKNKNSITEENMERLISETTQRIEIFQQTLDQLKELQGSLLEAGGDAAYEDLYYQKMIEEYYLSLPLFINSQNKDQKALAMRASKKKFH